MFIAKGGDFIKQWLRLTDVIFFLVNNYVEIVKI